MGDSCLIQSLPWFLAALAQPIHQSAFSILLEAGCAFPPAPIYCWFCFLLLAWTHEFLLLLIVYDSLLHLIILALKLSKIWPGEASSCWCLCPCSIHPHIFFFFSTSFLCGITRISKSFNLSSPCPATSHFFMNLWFPVVRNGIRDKDTELGRVITIWVSFLLDRFSKQS